MGLVSALLSEVWLAEQAANKESYVGNATQIRIHPEWFRKLMNDPEAPKHHSFIDGKHYLTGIPLIQTPKVEKWEIVI